MRRFLLALGMASVLGHAPPALADDTSELEGLLETSVVSGWVVHTKYFPASEQGNEWSLPQIF
jgi:hypothetical protein